MSKPIIHIRLVEVVSELELEQFRTRMTVLLQDEYHVIVTAGELEIKIIKP